MAKDNSPVEKPVKSQSQNTVTAPHTNDSADVKSGQDLTEVNAAKTINEIQTLKQERTLAIIRVVLTVVAALIAGVAIWVDRHTVLEDRRASANTARINRKVDRMTEIASGIDDILGSTAITIKQDRFYLEALTQIQIKLKELRNEIQSLGEDDTSGSDAFRDKAKKLTAVINFHLTKMPKRELGIDLYLEASVLQQRWAKRRHSATPDFQLYFGKVLTVEWEWLANKAWVLINMRFNIFSMEIISQDDTKEFERRAAVFQASLRRKIAEINVQRPAI